MDDDNKNNKKLTHIMSPFENYSQTINIIIKTTHNRYAHNISFEWLKYN